MSVKKVVVDAGHGGSDIGASGNGIVEKDLTLKISKYMADRFKALGVPVKTTRDSDIDLPKDERTKAILDKYGNGTDVIIISNHINAGDGVGAEVIYALRNKDTLASKIIAEISKEGEPVRKYYQRRLPTDTSKDYYYIMRDTPNTEALIVEYGFLDDSADATRLKNNYKKYAEAVVRAVTNYAGYKYVPLTGEGYYIVKSGDTLWTIANNFGLTVTELKALNNLASNTLNIGDVLLVKKATAPITPSTGYEYYTVVSEDSLYSIGQKYNLTVDELMKLNNLTSKTLSIGQKLIVGQTTSSNLYTVKSGDTLYSIANAYNVTVNELKAANNLITNTLSIGQELIIPSTPEKENVTTITYTVVKGDTLYDLAKKYNTTVTELKSLNNLTDSLLSIGQKLLIPS